MRSSRELSLVGRPGEGEERGRGIAPGNPQNTTGGHLTGFITDDTLLLCTKTGAPYYYEVPKPGEPVDTTVAACVDPKTPPGERPHSFRNSLVILQRGGKILEVGRRGAATEPGTETKPERTSRKP